MVEEKKAILLTGVSGGIGLETAKKFLSGGYHVIGLDIKEPKEAIEGLTFIKTDLTKEKEILIAFETISSSNFKLSSIICTAGIYDLNSLIEISEKEFIKTFDINVFATYRVNKIFLPLLKKGGKIIIISSELAPLDPLPFTGIYAMSKSLLENYAYSLRMELQLFGYKVVVIRPGAIDTGLIDISQQKLEDFVKNTTHYQTNSKRFKEIVNSVENRKIHPSKIASLIYKVNEKKSPKYVYTINRNGGLLILNSLPKKMQNSIIKGVLTKK